MKRLFISVFVLLLLVSCASTKAVIQSNFEGLPAWYTMPQASTNSKKYSFVGKGEGETKRQAELRALVNLYSELCNSLGKEEDDEQYRELTLTGKISSYGLKVTNKDVAKKNGTFTVYLRAKALKSLLEKDISPKLVSMREQLGEIEALILSGDEYIKADNDIEGAGKYIQSLCLSYENIQVENEYSFEEIFNECLDILSGCSISITNIDESKASCNVCVTRKDGPFLTKCIGCPVTATYTAVGVDGKEYTDTFVYRTDANGNFTFCPTNYSIVQTGSVTFSFGIEDEIINLENVAGKAKVKSLRDIFENSSKEFSYNLVYTTSTVGLAVVDFDINGDDSQYYTADYFRQKFKESKIPVVALDVNGQMEDKEIIEKASKLGLESLFVSRLQTTDIIKSSFGEYTVSCEGSFTVYDVKTGEILISSEPVNSTGFGQNEEEAERRAFYNLSDLFFSLLRSLYV